MFNRKIYLSKSLSGRMSNYFTRFIFILSLFAIVFLTACSEISQRISTDNKTTSSQQVISNIPNESPDVKEGEEYAVFAGGCFWGVEAVFEHIKGVRYVASGYSGGNKDTADYTAVSAGKTEHAEAVKIIYDPKIVSYNQLLEVFFNVAHNPTQLNRQGPDVGKQYRSAVFYIDEKQKDLTNKYITEQAKAETFGKPIVTQVVPLEEFYDAEEYHQDYMVKNPNQPYIVYHDKPKIENLSKKFPDLFKN